MGFAEKKSKEQFLGDDKLGCWQLRRPALLSQSRELVPSDFSLCSGLSRETGRNENEHRSASDSRVPFD